MKSLFVGVGLMFSTLLSAQAYTFEEKKMITLDDPTQPMAIFNVKEITEKQVLLAKSTDVPPRNKYTKILVDRMKLALQTTDGGVGIAAPQVGLNRNVVWVQRFDKSGFPLEYFLNPKITWKSQLLQKGPEGDLSIDDFREQFYRSYAIELEYEDLKGKKHSEHVEGFTAVIFQHEIDHLSGILIFDKFEKEIQNKFKEISTYYLEK